MSKEAEWTLEESLEQLRQMTTEERPVVLQYIPIRDVWYVLESTPTGHRLLCSGKPTIQAAIMRAKEKLSVPSPLVEPE